eukprot:9479751-Pyramimonas_sp.AAC.3
MTAARISIWSHSPISVSLFGQSLVSPSTRGGHTIGSFSGGHTTEQYLCWTTDGQRDVVSDSSVKTLFCSALFHERLCGRTFRHMSRASYRTRCYPSRR